MVLLERAHSALPSEVTWAACMQLHRMRRPLCCLGMRAAQGHSQAPAEGGGDVELTPPRRRAEYDYGERFDLKGPYCDNGYIDEDAAFGKQASQPTPPEHPLHPKVGWAGETGAERSRAAWPSLRACKPSTLAASQKCSGKQKCAARRSRASLALASSGLRRRRTRPRRASASSLLLEGSLGSARAGPCSL